MSTERVPSKNALAETSPPKGIETSPSQKESSSVNEAPQEEAPTTRTGKLDERKLKAFSAIVNFVTDLHENFVDGKKVTPLSLYNRLVVNHIKFTEVKRIDDALHGFSVFFDRHGEDILNSRWQNIPRDTVISYGTSDKICLEIQKYIYVTDDATRSVIRQHLLTIQACLKPSNNTILLQELNTIIERQSLASASGGSNGLFPNPPQDLKAALKIDETTNEGKFISGIMHKVKDSMQDATDTGNPAMALANLATSGVVQDLIGGLQEGVTSGQMDMNKLLQTMMGAMSTLMPQPQAQAVLGGTVPGSSTPAITQK